MEEELGHACHGEATHLCSSRWPTRSSAAAAHPALEDMLSAFRADIEVALPTPRLRGYTARSADPVGRLLLPLFGYRQPELVRYADEISTALQLTNFWQDVAADAARDHIYLPAEDLHFFGVTEAEVKALKPTRGLRDLMRYQVARTRALYERGRPLLHLLGSDLRMELTLIWLIGTTILDKIEDADFDVFTQRPQIRRRDKALIMARAAKGWASHMDLAALKALWPQ